MGIGENRVLNNNQRGRINERHVVKLRFVYTRAKAKATSLLIGCAHFAQILQNFVACQILGEYAR